VILHDAGLAALAATTAGRSGDRENRAGHKRAVALLPRIAEARLAIATGVAVGTVAVQLQHREARW
jgi:hypothetical protein